MCTKWKIPKNRPILTWINPRPDHWVRLHHVTKLTLLKLRDKTLLQCGQFELTCWHQFFMRPFIDDELRHNIVKVSVEPRAVGSSEKTIKSHWLKRLQCDSWELTWKLADIRIINKDLQRIAKLVLPQQSSDKTREDQVFGVGHTPDASEAICRFPCYPIRKEGFSISFCSAPRSAAGLYSTVMSMSLKLFPRARVACVRLIG